MVRPQFRTPEQDRVKIDQGVGLPAPPIGKPRLSEVGTATTTSRNPIMVSTRLRAVQYCEADTVLEEIDQRPDVQRLVIGMKRRSQVSRALPGGVAERLLLDSLVPVPVVKAES